MFKTRLSIFFTVGVLLIGCSTVAPPPPQKLSDVKTLPPHFVTNCRIRDLNGGDLRRFVGRKCIFFDDGSFIADDMFTLTAYDKNNTVKWKRKFTLIHHEFRKSEFADELLLLASDLTKKARSDVLVVTDLNGRILKSLKFNSLLKQLRKLKFDIGPLAEASWLKGVKDQDIENSHVNSFYEFYKIVDGKKQMAGYVVHCNMHKKILLLDPHLKEIVRVIDTGKRKLHDVRQRSEKELIFYENSYREFGEWKSSRISGYNLETGHFFSIYQPANPQLSTACSSVQMLGEDRLFITHSNCGTEFKRAGGAVMEYVDLKNDITVLQEAEEISAISSAVIGDLSGFLRNNQGL